MKREDLKQYKVADTTALLYEPFDIKKHVANFICYCEVVIWPDGKIEYAVPSHQQKLIDCYAQIEGISHEEAYQQCKDDWSLYDSLMKKTGICQIWYDHVYNEVPLTDAQLKSINMLIIYGCITDRALDTVQLF